MGKIASEDATTFVVERPDGTTSDPISKTGAPDLYKALSGGVGTGASIDQTIATGGGNWSTPGATPMAPVTPPVGGAGATGTWVPEPPKLSATQDSMNAPAAPLMSPGATSSLMTTKNTTQTTKTDPAAQSDLDKTVKSFADKARAEADSQAARHEQETELYKLQATDLALRNADIQQREERDALDADRLKKEVDAKNKEFNDAKIDPERLWGDKGTGNRLLAAIGIALGAVGQGLTGKENGAIGIVNAAIQRDIDVQKAMIEKMGKGAEMARGGLNDFYKILGDKRAGDAAEWTRQLEWYKSRLETIKSSNASTEAKARVEKEIAQVDVELAGKRAERDKVIQETVKETNAAKPMDMLSPDDARTLGDQEFAFNELNRLGERAAANDYEGLGPIDARLGAIADWAGISDPEAKKSRAAVTEAVSNKLRQLSGLGASDTEREAVANTLMKATDNPETFKAVLQDEMRKINAKVDMTRNRYRGLRTVPHDQRTKNFGDKPYGK